jgi:protein-tyrosine phosphatase
MTSIDYTAIPIEFDPTQQRMSGYTYYNNLFFDVPFISEITPTLWVGGCLDGLVLPSFIDHLVSVYPWESYTVNHELQSSLSVRMYDSPNQAMDIARSIATWVLHRVVSGGVTLVHCQAGLNRSSLIAALALRMSGLHTADEAINLIRKKRSQVCLCNSVFEMYVREMEI